MRCVLLAAFDDDEALFTAVMAGAQGYLLKQVGGTDLLDGIRAVAAGQTLLDRPVTERLLGRLRRSGQGDDGGPALDAGEQQLVELVTRGRTDAQIAAEAGTSETEVAAQVAAVLRQARSDGGPGRPAAPARAGSTPGPVLRAPS